MKVLLVGAGGREHALGWKILQSPLVQTLYWVSGPEASIRILRCQFPHQNIVPVPFEKNENLMSLVHKAKNLNTDLSFIGPDQFLADGLIDLFHRAKIPAFGPTQAASKLEWSKAFAKEIMNEAKVPTADFYVCENPSESESLLKKLEWSPSRQWVLKSDGLALGKGVEVCETLDQALVALDRLKMFSPRLVIEERLFGSEISWLAFCDGDTCALLDPARDYKTRDEGQQGPNTGGMGSISPVPHLSSPFRERIRNEVFLPTLKTMKARGMPFRGVLYAGLMVNESGFQVLEFNARFGDPETQALLPRLKGDLIPWLIACSAVPSSSGSGTNPGLNLNTSLYSLKSMPPDVPFDNNHACYVVTSAAGYPGTPQIGDRVSGLEQWAHSQHNMGFLSGVRTENDHFITSGGRVLGTLGLGSTPEEARKNSYKHLETVSFPKMHWRRDIGL